METYLRKSKIGPFFTPVIVFIMLILSACTLTEQQKPILTATATHVTQIPPTVTETVTPAQDGATSACYFNWAKEALPELSLEFEAALKDIQPQAKGYAEAYGEDCINQDNEVVYFVAMETDFHITLKVENLDDRQVLGELLERIFSVITEFPVEGTPGPQPGYVGITFESPGDSIRLWVTRTEIEMALENGLRGEELINNLQAK